MGDLTTFPLPQYFTGLEKIPVYDPAAGAPAQLLAGMLKKSVLVYSQDLNYTDSFSGSYGTIGYSGYDSETGTEIWSVMNQDNGSGVWWGWQDNAKLPLTVLIASKDDPKKAMVFVSEKVVRSSSFNDFVDINLTGVLQWPNEPFNEGEQLIVGIVGDIGNSQYHYVYYNYDVGGYLVDIKQAQMYGTVYLNLTESGPIMLIGNDDYYEFDIVVYVNLDYSGGMFNWHSSGRYYYSSEGLALDSAGFMFKGGVVPTLTASPASLDRLSFKKFVNYISPMVDVHLDYRVPEVPA